MALRLGPTSGLALERRDDVANHRRLLACGLMLAAWTPIAGQAGSAETAVRVLLLESREPIAVGGTRIHPAPGGLLAGARPLGRV